MRVRASSLAIASVIVAVALAAGTALAPSRQFPWHLCVAIVFPATVVVFVATGGGHNASNSLGVHASMFVISVVQWYFLIEAGRRWWPRRQP